MPYRMRRFTCAGCGMAVVRRRQADAKVHCTPCSIKRSVEAQRQMHAKSGPFWDAYVLAQVAAVHRMLASSAPDERPQAV